MWMATGIYLTLVVLLQPFYLYHINPDGTSYLSLAAKWANGDWLEGITGHWAPLFIWLLAAARNIGLGPFAAVTILDVLAALSTLAGLDRIARVLDLTEHRRSIVLSLAAVWLTAFTFDDVTPDLVLCSWLTWYLAIVIGGQFLINTRHASLLGLIAGLAYLTKPYSICFVFIHLAIATLWQLGTRRDRFRVCIPQALIIGGIVLLFVGSWTTAMSLKYHRFATGSAGEQCFRVISPRWPSMYINNIGLVEPPNETSTSYWEDPEVDKLRLPTWSPWESRESLLYYVRVICGNICQVGLWYLLVSLAAMPVLVLAVRRWNRGGRPFALGLILIAIVIYPAGYALLLIGYRYLWPIALWLIVLLGYVAPPQSAVAGLTLLCASFFPYPLWCLSADRGQGAIEHQIGAAMIHHHLKGKSASADEWHRSLYLSYYAGLQYCGTTTQRAGLGVRKELQQFGVQYLIVWPGPNQDIGRALGLTEIQDPAFGQVKIYVTN